MKSNPPKFLNNFLSWPVVRSNRTYKAFVVEPEHYSPKDHGEIFEAALNSLVSRQQNLVDEFDRSNLPAPMEGFDLLTFPEAFLPTTTLLTTLSLIHESGMEGCVHVGLRPSDDDTSHLFSVSELRDLVSKIRANGEVEQTDIDPFFNWLDGQHADLKFNVGCLFTVDSRGKTRVCFHPKMVRSKFEIGALPEDHMEEANLLTVVALRPVDKTFLTVYLQPLICSDALHLPIDRSGSRPLEAIHRDAECLGDTPPDHIDIVSVVTCTPQSEQYSPKSTPYRAWHDEFRKTFLRAAEDDSLARHHHAAFILSNFRSITDKLVGGLSGAFIPAGHERDLPGFVVSCWGRDAKERSNSNRWSNPDDDIKGWSDRCFIASLDPHVDVQEDVEARMFGFTLPQLPRHMSRWHSKLGLVKCSVRAAKRESVSRSLTFEAR